AFELEHDWQGNLATPRARSGERAKTRLLVILSMIWICMGLIGHEPWKPDESQSISIVKSMLKGESFIAPIAVGQKSLEHPPLYYLTAAGTAKAFSSILDTHDAARLVTGIWMAITLLMVGMIGRELWGYGAGRQTTFIFLGSLGLVLTAHLLRPEVAGLAGSAMGFYALALAKRRPYRASVLLGSGVGISFLAIGLIPALTLVLTATMLPIVFSAWRTRSYLVVASIALLFAAPWLIIWPMLSWFMTPDIFISWSQSSLSSISGSNFGYYLKTLSWYALPALPLAIWGLWHYRAELLSDPKFQLPILFFMVSFILIGMTNSPTETNALVFLLPLAALAGGSVETLKRGAAGLLNWFGLMLFGTLAFLIWLGWFAMQFGWPAKLNERMQVLSGMSEPVLGWLGLIIAIAITAIWLLVINNSRHSNRAAVTDWAVGSTMVWSLLMCLWLPWIDSARSYAGVMQGIGKAVPEQYNCMQSSNLGSAQEALLDYYTDIRVQVLKRGVDCNLHLIQDERGKPTITPGSEWQLIWEGKRAAERRESFRLYQRIN
ncbi:MAG: glycosyl transferase, partial [Nitrosomonadales bacterium]|nr:glycosyl transferase [Nitrosomonadales bacterium]